MIRLGIISDIHCHELIPGKQQGGYYFPSMPDHPIHQNPFASLKELIRNDDLCLDYLLSPGDYAHQIDNKGLKSSWDQLKIVSSELRVKSLMGTIGNHDVSSRNNGDSFSDIKAFDMDFPVYLNKNSKNYLNSLLYNCFYTIEDVELDILFIIVNSCYDHWDTVQARKGKVSKEDSERIKIEIDNSPRSRKVLMVHHHPIVHETGLSDTDDLIEGSEDLMKNIAGIDLIIHGHKHDFRFTQKKIFPKNLNILASGSFSCFKTSLKTNAQNAFHVIEFHSTDSLISCINQGVINTYLYDPIIGWQLDSNLEEGFGCTLSEQHIRDIVVEEFNKITVPYTLWKDVVENKGLLRYITRESRNSILSNLMEEGVIKRVTIDRFNNLHGDIILR
jgi:predicted phosphodiesterase